MSTFHVTAKNSMLDGLTVSHMQLHGGDPGSDGTANQVGSAEAVTFSAASGGARALSDDQLFTGLGDGTTITWFSVWDGDPSGAGTFKGKGQLSGDTAANSEGEYTVTDATELQITDPA